MINNKGHQFKISEKIISIEGEAPGIFWKGGSHITEI